jgi:hypothetical protein
VPTVDRVATVTDSARAETALPLPPNALADFIADSERLFRLNPHLEIKAWQPVPGGFRYVATNEINGRPIDTIVRVKVASDSGPLVLTYDGGLKQSSTFAVETSPEGARLIVTEHYPRVEDSRDPRLVDVDRSLIPWVAALRRHLIGRRRWGWLPGWHWWHERFMLSMPPRQRRIVRLIVWITGLEFVVFIAGIALWRLVS